MARDDKSAKKDFIKDQVRDRAKRQARDLVEGLTQRARQDVDHRLRTIDRERFDQDDTLEPFCGTRLESLDGLEEGVLLLFNSLHEEVKVAMDRGEMLRARELLGRMLALPLETLPRLRGVVLLLQAELEKL
jgi:hypothetical protein